MTTAAPVKVAVESPPGLALDGLHSFQKANGRWAASPDYDALQCLTDGALQATSAMLFPFGPAPVTGSHTAQANPLSLTVACEEHLNTTSTVRYQGR
jgi:hypothetical protein